MKKSKIKELLQKEGAVFLHAGLNGPAYGLILPDGTAVYVQNTGGTEGWRTSISMGGAPEKARLLEDEKLPEIVLIAINAARIAVMQTRNYFHKTVQQL